MHSRFSLGRRPLEEAQAPRFPLFPGLLLAFLAFLHTASAAQPAQATVERRIALTRQNSKASGSGTLVAPGQGRQAYTLHSIDARDFAQGGILRFQITLGTGEAGASFDLFPEGVPIPASGNPVGSAAGAYDIGPGEQVTLMHEFAQGQLFRFGATGNRASRQGLKNSYSFAVEVLDRSGGRPAGGPPGGAQSGTGRPQPAPVKAPTKAPTKAPIPAPAQAAKTEAAEKEQEDCDLSGLWKQQTRDVGGSLWSLTSAEGNHYQAQEQGLSGGKGTATFTDSLLRVDWRSGLGYAGYYEWRLDPKCSRGEGRAVGTQGLVGQRPSTVERIGGKGATGVAAAAPPAPGLLAPTPPAIAPLPTLSGIAPPPTLPAPVIPGTAAGLAPPGLAAGEPECGQQRVCGFCLGPEIGGKWRELGGEAGPLGCPAMSQKPAFNSLQGTAGQYAEFRGGEGAFIFLPTSGEHAGKTFVVEGCVFRVYKAVGTSLSFLGFPVGNAYQGPEGPRQDFEGGRIAWNAALQTCLALPPTAP